MVTSAASRPVSYPRRASTGSVETASSTWPGRGVSVTRGVPTGAGISLEQVPTGTVTKPVREDKVKSNEPVTAGPAASLQIWIAPI